MLLTPWLDRSDTSGFENDGSGLEEFGSERSRRRLLLLDEELYAVCRSSSEAIVIMSPSSSSYLTRKAG